MSRRLRGEEAVVPPSPPTRPLKQAITADRYTPVLAPSLHTLLPVRVKTPGRLPMEALILGKDWQLPPALLELCSEVRG
ncbi:hypothetical protein NHX12_006304 [Muraenolepis orangiensis]|uniref:Uncharacterized protein n=1 Tax=Muraenolepis orangiensis TaxID=630683 RepID=A0A9Q0DUJ3_9TELE|nr:hypothetical protein NHX12_006304 [Muraenolepis orangiensis]